MIACTNSNCKRKTDRQSFDELTKDIPEFQKQKAEKTGLGMGSTVWITVYKADGSLQCGQGKPIDIKEMEKDFTKSNIKVRSRVKKNDGLMRIQACGTPTGMINAYEIQKSNIEKAIELGYKELK